MPLGGQRLGCHIRNIAGIYPGNGSAYIVEICVFIGDVIGLPQQVLREIGGLEERPAHATFFQQLLTG